MNDAMLCSLVNDHVTTHVLEPQHMTAASPAVAQL